MRKSLAIMCGAVLACTAGNASAATVLDPTGDFLPSFVGARDADLDVTSFSVVYNPVASVFLLSATLAGTIDPSRPGLYVIGVNTGTGTNAPFASIGQPNVRFNQAISLQKSGVATISNVPLDLGSVIVAGNSFSLIVPLSRLTSTGFAPENYGFNLWPRNGTGNNNQISDFAPENALISAIPEPESWGLMVAGIGVAGAAMRRRRAGAAAAI